MLSIFATILDDNQRSFMEALYYDYRSIMYGAAFQVVQHHQDTEDIIHDTLIKLIEKTPLLMTFDCFTLRSYIVISVRRTAIDLLRKRGRKNELLFEEDSFLDTLASNNTSVDDELIREAEADQLHKALDLLKEKQRDLLNMRYFLNLNDEEIAEIYGLKSGSIRSLLSRARKELADIIRETENEQI
ncbi:MAG TPA: RNA polymerase sigma factor [Candidatus Syntrophosphaera sp.]|jgi:RNA polymerase sigma-70 factor (ECF subfamily)|nr:RNA polymerase sigma factor [Clostridia bacterium]HQP26763.1 RNA polymerase sigma factor [Candidatus Syntrophosphaera sp.]